MLNTITKSASKKAMLQLLQAACNAKGISTAYLDRVEHYTRLQLFNTFFTLAYVTPRADHFMIDERAFNCVFIANKW